MSFYNAKNEVKERGIDKSICITPTVIQAEIIAKVLNYYFDSEHFTENQSASMMHKNTSNALSQIADHVEKHEYSSEDIIEYLREISDELGAQSLVVSLRDELRFRKPAE